MLDSGLCPSLNSGEILVTRRQLTTFSVTMSSTQFSTKIQTTISPHSQEPYTTRTYPSVAELDATIAKVSQAQKQWAKVSLDQRIQIATKFVVGLAL